MARIPQLPAIPNTRTVESGQGQVYHRKANAREKKAIQVEKESPLILRVGLRVLVMDLEAHLPKYNMPGVIQSVVENGRSGWVILDKNGGRTKRSRRYMRADPVDLADDMDDNLDGRACQMMTDSLAGV